MFRLQFSSHFFPHLNNIFVFIGVEKCKFFYTVQTLLQEKLVNRNNFGLYLNRTKLSKKIILKNKCWQLYQIRLVYTRKYFISCANLPKKGLILQKCVFSQTFYTDLHTDISATSMKFCNSGLYLFVILVFYLLIIVCFLYLYLFVLFVCAPNKRQTWFHLLCSFNSLFE